MIFVISADANKVLEFRNSIGIKNWSDARGRMICVTQVNADEVLSGQIPGRCQLVVLDKSYLHVDEKFIREVEFTAVMNMWCIVHETTTDAILMYSE